MAEVVDALITFPRVYALSQRELYEKVIADIRDGNTDAVNRDLFQSYSENLRRGISGVLGQDHDGDKYLDMWLQFDANAARFAAYKAYHATQQLERQLSDSDGVARSPEDFERMAKAVLNTFNRYQAAEYNTAVSRARTAKQWTDFSDPDHAFLFPNLRWLPSRSATPREQHMPFYNRVWAKTDPFWNSNQPGNLWNCKCDWEETDDPVTGDNPEGIKPAKGLEGNPAETGQIFTDQCTYVQKAGKNTEHEALKAMWKDNFNWALEHVRGRQVRNPGVEEEINISRRGIKEFLNQNHDDYLAKNEMIRHIEQILSKAEYMGETLYGGRVSKIFRTKLCGKDNYIIVNYNDNGELNLHSITASPKVLTDIRK